MVDQRLVRLGWVALLFLIPLSCEGGSSGGFPLPDVRPPVLAIGLLATPSGSFAAQTPQVSLRPDLVSYAKANAASIGDALAFVCERVRESGSEQWLVLMEEPKKANGSSGSGMGVAGAFMKTLYTSTGHRYRFDDVPVGVRVQFIGPFRELPLPVQNLETIVRMNSLYLESGLYDAARLFDGMRSEGRKDPQISYFLSNNFSDEQIARDIKKAADERFTSDDERIYAKSLFALIQFGAVGFKTRGLENVLEEVVEKPGLFSGAFIQIDWAKIKAVDRGGDKRFVVPFAFQTKTSIKGLITIERPLGRVQRCGGITALEIRESSKNPGTRVALRMIEKSELE